MFDKEITRDEQRVLAWYGFVGGMFVLLALTDMAVRGYLRRGGKRTEIPRTGRPQTLPVPEWGMAWTYICCRNLSVKYAWKRVCGAQQNLQWLAL